MDLRMLIAGVAISLFTASCSKHDVVEVEISNEVVNPDYIGNGVEWDPYDEAELWAPVFRMQIGIHSLSVLTLCGHNMYAA